jgi:cytochrome c553
MTDIFMKPSTLTSLCSALLTTSLFFSSAALAASQQELATNGMAATCANCHGTFGKSIQDGALPSLAGMKNDYFIEQMQAFKSGARKATIMHQLAKGYNDQQIKDLAAYFAAQSR